MIVGYGRLGPQLAAMLERAGAPFVVIEQDRTLIDRILESGAFAVHGDASSDAVLVDAGIRHARVIVILARDGLRARRILAAARVLNPLIKSAVRADDETELEHLKNMGANVVTSGEQQLVLALGEYAVECLSARNEADSAT